VNTATAGRDLTPSVPRDLDTALSREPQESGDATSINALIRFGLEKGGAEIVPAIRELVELRWKMEERDARKAFFDALSQFRAKCPPILKTRENEQFTVTRRGGAKVKAKYAPLDEIDRIARPIASECGLTWTWNTRVDGSMMTITCRVMHILGYFEESSVTMPCESKAGSSPQQKYGSAQTYGMRYSLVAALGITTADTDVDGITGEGESEKITDEEAARLSALISEVMGTTEAADIYRTRLLKWLAVETINDIDARDFQRTVAMVEAKRSAQ
jgi:hypothetical protein